MKFQTLRSLMAFGLVTLMLAGCASMDDDGMMDEMATEPTTMAGSEDKMMMSQEGLKNVFYFDYDRAVVRRSSHKDLDMHAKVLQGDRSVRVTLEGHADERGTREYNLALGERRANAVRAYLIAQGASRAQIDVTSLGEEKPANARHNERAWAQNRRVEVIYR